MRRVIASIVLAAALVGSVVLYQRVFAVDGSGTNTVSPSSVSAGSTGNDLAFTYTALETTSSGEVSIAVPSGWSAPQGTAGTAGYVTATSASGTVADVLNTLDSAAGWAGSAAHMTLSTDTGDYQEGTGSLVNTISSTAAANEDWYFNYGSAKSWGGAANGTNGQRVGMWLKSSVNTLSGDLSWQSDNAVNLGSPEDTLAIAALTANTWKYTSVTLGAPRTSQRSYGLQYTSDIGAASVKLDAVSVLFDAADVTTNWTGDSNITVGAVGSGQEGTNSIRCTYAAAAGIGTSGECYRTSSALTVVPGNVVSFWVRSSVALSANQFAWVDDNSAGLASPTDVVNMPAILANTWTYVTLSIPGIGTSSIRSYGLRQLVDKGAMTIDIDAMGTIIDAGDSTAGWAAVAGDNITTSSDAITVQEGSASLKAVISSTSLAGDYWYQALSSAQDWSAYTTVGLWARSTVATNAGDLKFQYSSASDLSSTIASVNIGALSANTWSYQVLTLSGARTTVNSYGINYATDIGAAAVYLDDVLIGPGVPTFPGGNEIRVRLLQLTTGQTVVTHYGSGGGTSGATAPTASGSYTFTTQSRVSDSGTLTNIVSSPSVTVTPGATSQFLLNDPGNITAGTRAAYTVTRKDSFGNAVTSGAQTVYLYSNSTGNKAFYTVASGGTPVASITIADSASTADFWYYDDLAGTFAVTSSDNATAPDGATGIADATDSITISAAATSQFLLNDPGSMTAGTRLGYTVTRKDAFNNLVTSGAQTVYLYSNSTGNKAFYAASSGGSPITSIAIADASSSANFWYYDDKAGTFAVTSSDNATAPDGATGIADATDSVIVSASSTSQFTLNDPGSMTAGTRLGYTVTRTDGFGNATTSGAQTVYLYSTSTGLNKAFYAASSGGTPITSIAIADASSTANFWYYDDLAGTYTITASDNATAPDGATGIADATDSVTVSAGSTSQFTLNDPGAMTAGTRLGYTVTRKDTFNNVVTAGTQTVYLYSNSTGNKAFYAASSGGSPITSIAIADASSSASFWYYDDLAGTFTVTSSDNATAPDGATGIVDATDSVTVSAGSTSQFTLNDPGNMTAGTRLGYTVTRKDAFNNAVTSGAQTVYLYSNSTGNTAFYAASSGGSPITSIAIADASSTVNFWYYDDKAGAFTVTTSDNATAPDGATGITDATDSVIVSASSTSQFTLNDPGTMTAGTRLGYTVARSDQFGNATTSGAETVYLYSTSTGLNKAFYAASSGGSPITSIAIADASSSVGFWYYDDVTGTFTITASDSATAPDGTTGIDDATDSVVVAQGPASQYTLNDPGSLTAGTRLAYTVTRKDAFGNATPTGTDTVYLYSDSTGNKAFYDAATNGNIITSVSITPGNSSANFWYYDDKTGAFTITASDNVTAPDGTAGIDDATDSVVVNAAASALFTLNSPADITAGNRAAYTVTRKDAFNNLVTSGAQTVYLYSDSTGNAAFYSVSSGGSPVVSIAIADASPSADFWYYDDLTGTFTVTSSDNATAPDGTTGIDDATDTIGVSAAATSQFTLNDPGSISVGNRAAYTVTRKDAFNNVVTSGAQTVYLYSNSTGNKAFYAASSGGSPITSIAIADASSTANFWYYDDAVGTFTVTVSDSATAPDGATGIDDATDSITVTAAPAALFVLNSPADISAGNRAAYTVTRKDGFNNLVTSGIDTVYLYSDSLGGKAFYESAIDGALIASIDITEGNSSADFWYYDDKAGAVTVSVSDNAIAPDGTAGIDDATDALGIVAAPTESFFLNNPGNLTAGERLAYVVTRRDAFDNPVTAGTETVYLYSDSTGNKAFYDAATNGNLITSVNLTGGNSSASFWYYDDKADTITVTASDNATVPDGATGIYDATDGVVVVPAPASQFTLNDPGNMAAGTRLGYTVTRKDAFNNLVTSGAQTVYLYSNSTGNKAFYAASTGGSPITSIAIADTASLANFWYYDDKVGTFTVTASDSATAPDGATGIDDATDDITVTPAATAQFVLSSPADFAAGTRAAYTVTRTDAFGNATSSGAQTVHLYSDSTGSKAFYSVASGGSPITSIAIADTSSVGDFWYYDDKVGTVTVTGSDNAVAPDGVTGIDDGTDSISITAAATSQFFLSDPGNVSAGLRIGYTVSRKDAFGNVVTSGADTVYIYSSSANNPAFYASAIDGSPITSVIIADTASSANFWYYDEAAGTVTISASDSALAPDGTTGIDDATDEITVTQAATAQFLLNDPGNMVAGTRLGYTVSRKDIFGNLVTSGADTVYLYSDSTGNKAFYDAATDGNIITSITIADTSSSASFWYYDDKVGTVTVTGSDSIVAPDGITGIDDGTDSVTVSAGPTAQFLLNDPGNMSVASRLGYTVTRKDAFGNTATAGVDVVHLYSDSTGNIAFYDAASAGNLIASVSITEGNSTANFWYYDDALGIFTVTASDSAAAPDGITGIDDGTDSVTITAAVATRFVIVQPADGTTEVPSVVTVRAEDDSGNLASTYQDDVTLNASGSATGDGLVNIVNGVGTLSVSNTVVETVHLTLQDTEITGLNVDSTKDVNFTAGPTRQYLLTDPGDMVAGNRIGYTVTRKDAFNNVVTAGAETVYLYSDSTGPNAVFYSAAVDGGVITSVVFSNGNSTADFWYYDDKTGTFSVTVSDNETAPDGLTNIDDATDSIAVSAAGISEFTLSNPGNMVAGTRLGYTVTRKDQFGNLVTSGSQTAYLYSDSTGNKTFHDAATDGALINSVAITEGNSSADFWYYDDKTATVTVTVSDNPIAPDGADGVNDALRSPSISAAATGQFLLNDPGNMSVNTRVGYTVTRKDAYGNLVTSGTDVVYLYTDSSGAGASFYSAATDGVVVTSVQIENGNSSQVFWYFDDTAGVPTITVSDSASAPDGTTGINDAADSVTVTDIPIVATRLVIQQPTGNTAGQNVLVTIRAEDDFGSVDTTFQTDVTLVASGSATGAGLVDMVNGVGEKTITNAVAETVLLSLSDTAGTGLNVSSTREVIFTAGITAQYLLNDPGNATAGVRIEYQVSRKDSLGNLVTAGSETGYLFSSLGAPATFYDAASGGSQTLSVVFADGQSSVSFWYANEQTGSDTILVSDSEGNSAGTGNINLPTDAIGISAAPVSQFLLSNPGDMSINTRVGYSITRKDQFGNLVTAGSQGVYLYSDSTGNKTFHDAATDGNIIAVVTIGDGASSGVFWYFDDTEGFWTITASDNASAPDGATGIADGTDTITATNIVITATRFVIQDPENGTVGQNILVTVRAEDNFGSVDTAIQTDVTLSVSGSAIGGGLVDIVNGIGTVSITDTVVESVLLSLSDTASSGLDVSSTQQVEFGAAATALHGGGGSTQEAAPPVVVLPPTVLSFSGVAYPGASVSLFGKTITGAVLLAQAAVDSLDGSFALEYKGPFAGIVTYEVDTNDSLGNAAPPVLFAPTITPNVVNTVTFLTAPTINILRSTVLRGLQFIVSGYAAPGSKVELSVDGADPTQSVRAGSDGFYKLFLDTLSMNFGAHTLHTRQITSDGITTEYGNFESIFVSRLFNSQMDLNHDDAVNILDWSIFLVQWSSTDPAVRALLDFNSDGVVNASDFSIFVRAIRR